MNALPPAIRAPIRAEIFRQAGELAGAMKTAVPHKAGTLQASIRVEAGTRSRMAALVRAGGRSTTQQVGTGFFSAFSAAVRGRGDYDYAIAQEFGTSKHPAQPFFFPTYRAKKRAIRKAIKDRAKAEIGKLVPLS